ncbi:MAG: hypothetical protein RBS77_03580 [Candidatus Moranbacteria bacterium]|jgi:hypothetical protein|nr:hypothetical protein [Candidatus Moranbacteria bacterium]
MRTIKGMMYRKFFPHGHIFANDLRRFIEDDFPLLIIVVTKAAGREGGFNADLYSFKELISPDELMFLVAEPVKKEEILICDCCDLDPDKLWSETLGRNIVLRE